MSISEIHFVWTRRQKKCKVLCYLVRIFVFVFRMHYLLYVLVFVFVTVVYKLLKLSSCIGFFFKFSFKINRRYPIHLAILGGSLKLLRWLTEERYCPLREIKKRSSKKVGSPIVTSRGRSTLSIALLHQKLDIVRYLIVDRGLSLFEERDLNNDNNSSSQLALANFTSLLKLIPKDFLDDKDIEPTPVPRRFTQQQQEMFSQSLSTDFFMTDR